MAPSYNEFHLLYYLVCWAAYWLVKVYCDSIYSNWVRANCPIGCHIYQLPVIAPGAWWLSPYEVSVCPLVAAARSYIFRVVDGISDDSKWVGRLTTWFLRTPSDSWGRQVTQNADHVTTAVAFQSTRQTKHKWSLRSRFDCWAVEYINMHVKSLFSAISRVLPSLQIALLLSLIKVLSAWPAVYFNNALFSDEFNFDKFCWKYHWCWRDVLW